MVCIPAAGCADLYYPAPRTSHVAKLKARCDFFPYEYWARQPRNAWLKVDLEDLRNCRNGFEPLDQTEVVGLGRRQHKLEEHSSAVVLDALIAPNVQAIPSADKLVMERYLQLEALGCIVTRRLPRLAEGCIVASRAIVFDCVFDRESACGHANVSDRENVFGADWTVDTVVALLLPREQLLLLPDGAFLSCSSSVCL